MTDKADHIAWAADAIAVYQRHCRTGDEHAIKFVEACLREDAIRPAPAFRAAARDAIERLAG